MVGEANQSANSIIAQALRAAGVREQNIELPPDEGKLEPQNPYVLEGAPKGEVIGEPGDSSNVEPEDESTEPEPSKPKSEKPSSEKPLSKAEIEASINQATARFQSIMDKKLNLIQNQVTGVVTGLNKFFENQETVSLLGLPAEEQVLRRLERLEPGGKASKIEIPSIAEPAQPDQTQMMYQFLANLVDAVGLRIDDKRLDWSEPTKFITTLKSSLAEDYTKAINELKNNGNKELQKIRKKTGVDKVSQSGPGGAGLPDIDKMTPMEKLEYGFKQAEEAAQLP